MLRHIHVDNIRGASRWCCLFVYSWAPCWRCSCLLCGSCSCPSCLCRSCSCRSFWCRSCLYQVLLLLSLLLLVPGAPPAGAALAWWTASPAPGGAGSTEWTALFPAAAISGAAFNTPTKTPRGSSVSPSSGGFRNPVSNRLIDVCTASFTLETGGGGELFSVLLCCCCCCCCCCYFYCGC